MSYKLKFFKSAYKEWQKLDPHIRTQFKTHLRHRLENPHVPSARLRGYPNLYKIKLAALGYRLAYLVEDEAISIFVICVGHRDKVYELLRKRIEDAGR
jgi:mRNA interferase RelE/StbE